MLLTTAAGLIGFAIGGPIGAGALGGLAAVFDPNLVESGQAQPQPYKAPTPTRATSSQWVDPVDPEFQ